MLHTIRHIIGDDDRWRAILRGLNAEFRHRIVTGQQVQEYMAPRPASPWRRCSSSTSPPPGSRCSNIDSTDPGSRTAGPTWCRASTCRWQVRVSPDSTVRLAPRRRGRRRRCPCGIPRIFGWTRTSTWLPAGRSDRRHELDRFDNRGETSPPWKFNSSKEVETMKVYGSNAIRNVAFVGHGASGKTSLVDALAWVSGSSRRHGSIKDGTTLTDYSPDEIERKHSINLALGYAEWLDTKLNLIDTPGYLDYFGEVVTGLHAADAAVVVVSGTGGVEVGTEKVWEACDQLHLPRMLFVSMMDKEHADFERVYQDIKAHLTPKVVPVEVPIGDGPAFHGIINLFSGPLPQLQEGHRQERVRGGPHPGGVPAALPGVQRAAHRGGRLHRRRADRALPGGRGDPTGAVHRRGEARDARRPDRAPVLRERHAHLRPAHPAQEDGRAAPLAGRSEAPGGGAAGGAGVQDPLRGARRRRHAVPPLQRRAEERRRGVERGARDGGEAEPPLHPAGQGADRGRAAERRRHRLGGQAARHPYRRHVLPPRPRRSGCRRFRCPRRSRPRRCW